MSKKKDKDTDESRKPPSKATVRHLWATAAGRCQLEGCNKELSYVRKKDTYLNRAYVAHIHAASKTGPRYSSELSRDDAAEFNNLMLLCDACHRMIDQQPIKEFTHTRLFAAKAKHLADIKRLTDTATAPRTQLLIYGAKIGAHETSTTYEDVCSAVLPLHQPNDSTAIAIRVEGLFVKDRDQDYWKIQEANLRQQFTHITGGISRHGKSKHYSVFAMAPQPLLILLGVLLGEVTGVNCYQRFREPAPGGWGWRKQEQTVAHTIKQQRKGSGQVALSLSLSAHIDSVRITNTLGTDCAIWNLTHPQPHNDYLQSAADLSDFRKVMRVAYDRIKAAHGPNTVIHLFPAGPVSTMVEAGRVWMPKADLPIKIYDQNNEHNGFIESISTIK